jgi:hypothetical protein
MVIGLQPHCHHPLKKAAQLPTLPPPSSAMAYRGTTLMSGNVSTPEDSQATRLNTPPHELNNAKD